MRGKFGECIAFWSKECYNKYGYGNRMMITKEKSMIKKVWKRLVACTIAIVMAFALSSCSVIRLLGMIFSGLIDSTPELTLEYTLTQEEVNEFHQLADECETLGLQGTDVWALSEKMMDMNSLMQYIDAQSTIGYLEYCMDQADPTALAHYEESEAAYMGVRTRYLSLLKTLAQNSPIKDELFSGWSEEDMKMLFIDNEKISEIQLSNSELQRKFYEIDRESETWSEEVAYLYEDLVENNQTMAKEYGYKNYYDFASDLIYGRKYTKQQRTDFRGYVAEYIVPLYKTVNAQFETVASSLTYAQKVEYNAIFSNSSYLNSYMGTFNNSIRNKMNNMFTLENAAIYGTSDNALQGAFTTYIDYFQQPIAYFGPGYQDLYTVVHELGHYTAYYYFDGSTLPYDLAEVHSQGNEWLFTSYLKNEECLKGNISSTVFDALYLNNLISSIRTVLYATVVDHFEELVYTAEVPVAMNEYATVMESVCAQYDGLLDVVTGLIAPFAYAQHVTMTSPGYYLSYATSQIASIGIYVLAEEQGYEKAVKAYTLLQEGIDREATFTAAITQAGLLSPFEKSTYTKLQETFVKGE